MKDELWVAVEDSSAPDWMLIGPTINTGGAATILTGDSYIAKFSGAPPSWNRRRRFLDAQTQSSATFVIIIKDLCHNEFGVETGLDKNYDFDSNQLNKVLVMNAVDLFNGPTADAIEECFIRSCTMTSSDTNIQFEMRASPSFGAIKASRNNVAGYSTEVTVKCHIGKNGEHRESKFKVT